MIPGLGWVNHGICAYVDGRTHQSTSGFRAYVDGRTLSVRVRCIRRGTHIGAVINNDLGRDLPRHQLNNYFRYRRPLVNRSTNISPFPVTTNILQALATWGGAAGARWVIIRWPPNHHSQKKEADDKPRNSIFWLSGKNGVELYNTILLRLYNGDTVE